ncbi:hypothetical protein OIU79_021008 [Salix purpurea]|uniref:Uncharacterized protein n=1 Tax=Salix purpurea TaxID=77065 RepID=A0A9Q0WNF8_SALPP|nr:hypothetical protein OIU79_021008 [Salix purpurea]
MVAQSRLSLEVVWVRSGRWDCFCGRFVWPAGLLRPKRGADGKKGSSRWLEGRSDQESWRSGGVDWQYQEERKGG